MIDRWNRKKSNEYGKCMYIISLLIIIEYIYIYIYIRLSIMPPTNKRSNTSVKEVSEENRNKTKTARLEESNATEDEVNEIKTNNDEITDEHNDEERVEETDQEDYSITEPDESESDETTAAADGKSKRQSNDVEPAQAGLIRYINAKQAPQVKHFGTQNGRRVDMCMYYNIMNAIAIQFKACSEDFSISNLTKDGGYLGQAFVIFYIPPRLLAFVKSHENNIPDTEEIYNFVMSQLEIIVMPSYTHCFIPPASIHSFNHTCFNPYRISPHSFGQKMIELIQDPKQPHSSLNFWEAFCKGIPAQIEYRNFHLLAQLLFPYGIILIPITNSLKRDFYFHVLRDDRFVSIQLKSEGAGSGNRVQLNTCCHSNYLFYGAKDFELLIAILRDRRWLIVPAQDLVDQNLIGPNVTAKCPILSGIRNMHSNLFTLDSSESVENLVKLLQTLPASTVSRTTITNEFLAGYEQRDLNFINQAVVLSQKDQKELHDELHAMINEINKSTDDDKTQKQKMEIKKTVPDDKCPNCSKHVSEDLHKYRRIAYMRIHMEKCCPIDYKLHYEQPPVRSKVRFICKNCNVATSKTNFKRHSETFPDKQHTLIRLDV